MRLFSKKRVYLDWASAAPVTPSARKAFLHALRASGNPSSPHAEGVLAHTHLAQARACIARLAGVKDEAVVFTSGATEANNLAILGRINACSERGIPLSKQHVLYLPTMHASALKVINELSRRGVITQALPIKNYQIDIEACRKLVTPDTVLVAADAVCGETGTRFNVRDLATLLQKSACPEAHLHVDATQLPLIESINYTRLKTDSMTLDGQKIGGVRGAGALIIPNRARIRSIMYGGGQEEGLRPGTEPVALVAAFAETLHNAEAERTSFNAYAASQRERLINVLSKELHAIQINAGKHTVPHILNLSFPGLDTEYAVMLLDAEGFAVATRSACEADSEDGSTVVGHLTGEEARARSTLRISWGPGTTNTSLARFARALIRTVVFLQKNSSSTQ